ncbi:hypothetical protein IX339_000850 [Porphyromonas levii]|uniref:hypothetical protein n=1 Tax=Porphyromonas levii TaxID=28114 RepID=UPI001B8BC35A|nr:hypothetical protein [Porphyromonas levii]MBR8731404.1 hypothetical protein [Porphyromonas levii]MBR8759812.1 hypothetical protein [Porphyromonas levii]
MREIELNVVGLEPMREEEEREVTGGIGVFAGGLIITLIASAIDNWQDIREGFSDGINGREPRH